MVPNLDLLPAGVLVAACTWTDAKYRMIYNYVTYPAIITGLFLSLFNSRHENIYGSIIIFFFYFLFFLGGKMGGGDLKLAVALSLLLGMEPVLLGSILAGVVMMFWGFALTWYRTGRAENGLLVAIGKLPGGEMPYGALLGLLSLAVALL
ncbi:MAG: A24 family peptidase [Bacillota bacterium]